MKTISKLYKPLYNTIPNIWIPFQLKGTASINTPNPFWVMVKKEITDHVRSWRFIVLLLLMAITCFGSLYISLGQLSEAINNFKDPNRMFVYLRLLTISDGTLPPFHAVIGLLGPLLGISLGFDAINSEHNKGSLVRVVSQPIYRDYIINAKFISALIIIFTLFFSLGFLLLGCGILVTGLTPTPEEFLRITTFILVSIVYVSFWLNLSILFSIKFKQAATSALTAISVWLFFAIFYQILINMVTKAVIPSTIANPGRIMTYKKFFMGLMNVAPSQLYTDATTSLLAPSVRSLGPLTFSQTIGAIPSALPLRESLLITWPQLTGLVATTIVCFAVSYFLFMKREIRA